MAPPSHKSILNKYQTEIKRSLKWRRDEGYDDLWRRMIDLYRGKPYNARSPEDRMLVNMSKSTKDIIAASTMVRNPKFAVNAKKPSAMHQSVIAEEVLNYVWRVNKYKKQARLAIDDFLMVGHGWAKIGYKFVKEEITIGGQGDYGDEGVAEYDPMLPSPEMETRVLDDRPVMERVSVFDMFVNPEATQPSNMRWIAQRIKRRVADIKVDERYDKHGRSKVTSGMSSRYDDDDPRDRAEEKGEQKEHKSDGWTDVWEFYDIAKGQMCVFADNAQDTFLIKPKPMDYTFGHPFRMVRNYEIPDYFYPMGELEAMEGLQLELNETRTQMMNHRKRFARKYLALVDALGDRGMAALESDKDNTIVPVEGDVNLNEVVAALPALITPADHYQQSDVIISDINMVTGVSDYMRGNADEIRRTATEAGLIADQAQARAEDKLERIEEFISDIGSTLLQVMQQLMTGEQVIRIVGSESNPIWIRYTAEYIQGEFDLEVEAGSTTPMNESQRRQQALQMVDALAPFISMGVIDPMRAATEVLRRGFGVKQPEQFISPMYLAQMGMQGMGGPQQPGLLGPDGQPMPPSQPGAPQGPPGLPPGIPPELAMGGMPPQGMPM